MSKNDDQKLRELEGDLDSALDEDSISELLAHVHFEEQVGPEEQVQSDQRARTGKRARSGRHHQRPNGAGDQHSRKTLRIDSEALLSEAPSTDAYDDPPTVEADVGKNPGAYLPEAAVVSPRKRSKSSDKSIQPPPIPGKKRPSSSPSHRAPARPPKRADDVDARRGPVDLRPSDRRPDKRWQLEQTPLTSVLLELVKTSGLGLLEMRTGTRRAQLVVEDGQLYEVNLLPASPKRSLSAFLQRGGKLNAQQAAAVRKSARKRGVAEADVLLDAPSLVSPRLVRSAVCSRTRYLLRRLMEANLERAAFYPLDDGSRAPMLVSVPLVSVLFAHVRAGHSGKFSGRRDRARQRFLDMQLSIKPTLAFSVNQLGMKLHERQLVDRVLVKSRPFEKVLRNSPVARDETIALLAALEAVGLLSVEAPGLSEIASTSWAEDRSRTLERVELMEARLERENLFTLFGLHWTTYEAEIVRNYRKLADLFEATNQPLGLSAAERKRIKAVGERIDALYERLSEPEGRQRYRRKLIGTATRQKAAKKLEKLADTALRRKSVHSALDYYQRLLEVDPDHRRASQLLPVLIARANRR